MQQGVDAQAVQRLAGLEARRQRQAPAAGEPVAGVVGGQREQLGDQRGGVRNRGAETEADWRLSGKDRLRLTYAYLEVSASNAVDTLLTPRHSGSAGWLRNWGQGWNSALFYYGANALNGYRFARVDARLAKRIRVAGSEIELAGVLQQRLDDEPLSMPNNNYDERHVTWLTAEFDF